MLLTHRHLREIDCSSSIAGVLAAGAESRGKSIHWTCMWHQKVLHSGCSIWRHNYYSQQRQAGRANEQSTSLRCLCSHPLPLECKFRRSLLVCSDQCWWWSATRRKCSLPSLGRCTSGRRNKALKAQHRIPLSPQWPIGLDGKCASSIEWVTFLFETNCTVSITIRVLLHLLIE